MLMRNFVGRILIALFAAVTLAGMFPGVVSAQVPANVRVGLITANSASQYLNASAVTVSVKGSYQVLDLAAIPGENVIGTPAEGESWQVYYLPSGLQVYKNGEPLKITSGPVVVRETSHDSDNYVSLDSYMTGGASTSIGKKYRANMEFRSNGSSVSAINELPMDEYLYGVVPREMSNGWPLDALKAQALAARTYTTANYNKRAVEGFNMLDTPTDQAYGGMNSEGDNATRAVQETSGKIILFNGQPISAVYHSTSGGYTEDNENVWSGTPSAYLRGKPDPYSTKHGLANWAFTSTIDNIRNELTTSSSISNISLEKYSSGRVKTVIITDVSGNTITKSGSEFGKLFNPKFYTEVSNTSFMSNFFDVKMDQVATPEFTVLNGAGQKASVPGTNLYAVSDDGSVNVLNENSADFYAIGSGGTSSFSKAATGTVVFEGHGWGHGVGMSQWGAYEMAAQGKSYEEIINFYYTGVELGN